MSGLKDTVCSMRKYTANNKEHYVMTFPRHLSKALTFPGFSRQVVNSNISCQQVGDQVKTAHFSLNPITYCTGLYQTAPARVPACCCGLGAVGWHYYLLYANNGCMSPSCAACYKQFLRLVRVRCGPLRSSAVNRWTLFYSVLPNCYHRTSVQWCESLAFASRQLQ